MKFQDDVESGRRSRKKDMTMLEQVERYRHKLMQKVRTNLFYYVDLTFAIETYAPGFKGIA